jgi:hypothetical protein
MTPSMTVKLFFKAVQTAHSMTHLTDPSKMFQLRHGPVTHRLQCIRLCAKRFCASARATGGAPYIGRMKRDARLELRLSAAQRRELAALADETGLTSADLARLGVRWLLAHRGMLVNGPSRDGERAASA